MRRAKPEKEKKGTGEIERRNRKRTDSLKRKTADIVTMSAVGLY